MLYLTLRPLTSTWGEKDDKTKKSRGIFNSDKSLRVMRQREWCELSGVASRALNASMQRSSLTTRSKVRSEVDLGSSRIKILRTFSAPKPHVIHVYGSASRKHKSAVISCARDERKMLTNCEVNQQKNSSPSADEEIDNFLLFSFSTMSRSEKKDFFSKMALSTYPRQRHEFSSSRDRWCARHRLPMFLLSHRRIPARPSRCLARQSRRAIGRVLIYRHLRRQADPPAKWEKIELNWIQMRVQTRKAVSSRHTHLIRTAFV